MRAKLIVEVLMHSDELLKNQIQLRLRDADAVVANQHARVGARPISLDTNGAGWFRGIAVFDGVGEQVHDHQLHPASVGGKLRQSRPDVDRHAASLGHVAQLAGDVLHQRGQIDVLLVWRGLRAPREAGEPLERACDLRQPDDIALEGLDDARALGVRAVDLQKPAATCRTLSGWRIS